MHLNAEKKFHDKYIENGIKCLHSKLAQMPRFILSNLFQEGRKQVIVLVSFPIVMSKDWPGKEEGHILVYLLRGSSHPDKVCLASGAGAQLLTLHLQSGKRDK